MVQKLPYQSPKWEKEIQRDAKRYKQLKGLDPILHNMERTLSYEINKGPNEKNYVGCYTSLRLKYRMLAERSYLRNNRDFQAISYTYLSGIAAIFSYLFDIISPHPIKRDKTDQINMIYDFSYGLFQLFAVQGFLPQCLAALEHPEVQLLLGNFEQAVELLSSVSSTYTPQNPYTVLMSDRNQAILKAMAGKDEKTLNALLIDRVKAYRKQPLDYSTFIDAYSIAYIKLSNQFGMNCALDIIEVPKIFFEDTYKIDIGEWKLPFFDEAVEQLHQQGFNWTNV